MFQKLVSHNKDIQQLVDKGYAVAFDSNCLIIRDIPYLNEQAELQIGAIVCKLVFVNEVEIKQDDHQIYFAGSVPHNINKTPIPNLAGGLTKIELSNECRDVVVQRSFSNKPRVAQKFSDFFEKIESYVAIISGPAIELHGANPYTYRISDKYNSDSIFKFQDTLTSRAQLGNLSAKLEDEVVAIIGLGGTGSYLLDFIVKCRVKEIRGFDLDDYHVHNAFRSPGKLEPKELGKPKAEVYKERYDNFRTGLIITKKFINSDCTEDFQDVTFAFVCVDKGSSRAEIFKLLISLDIPFIDVGMGLNRNKDLINGMLRTTYYPTGNGQEVLERNWAELKDNQNDLYRANIQISELNALNASLAVIRYKQIRGFYFEELPYENILFEVGDMKVVAEDAKSNENSE